MRWAAHFATFNYFFPFRLRSVVALGFPSHWSRAIATSIRCMDHGTYAWTIGALCAWTELILCGVRKRPAAIRLSVCNCLHPVGGRYLVSREEIKWGRSATLWVLLSRRLLSIETGIKWSVPCCSVGGCSVETEIKSVRYTELLSWKLLNRDWDWSSAQWDPGYP